MIIEEIKHIKDSKKDLKKFGITIGIVLLILCGILFLNDKLSYIYFGTAGLAFLLSAFLFPIILKPINKIWMTLAVILSWIMTRVILTILFYIILTPIGLIAKMFGKDFLNLKIDKSKKTYWEKREFKKNDSVSYEKQF